MSFCSITHRHRSGLAGPTQQVVGFQISDFRFQISDFGFQISDFRFQIYFRSQHQADRFLREISDFRFQIPEGTMAEISTGNRILNAQNTFQDFITDFCVTQISDFRSQNSQIADFRFQISDFRSQNAGHTQAQISAFRKQISKKPGHIPERRAGAAERRGLLAFLRN